MKSPIHEWAKGPFNTDRDTSMAMDKTPMKGNLFVQNSGLIPEI